MGYREAALPNRHPQLRLDGTSYDIDYFGMDDGRAEAQDAAFRFIFQLGLGYMIYLYVIQAGGRRSHTHFFHTFWTKDCAVAEVEREDHGAPSTVCAEQVELPLNYPQATLLDGRGGEASLEVTGQRFSAPSSEKLRMEFSLSRGRLLWTRRSGWEIEADGLLRPLRPEERLVFSPPGE